MLLRSPTFIFSLLFFIAILALFPGISEITGITGKDEYYLTIRTPMHMIEGGHGWLPWLDGLPRLQKPPLMYWLGKISFELFGVSLISARMIGVVFAALLVVTSASISYYLSKNKNTAMLTGLLILGMAGVMIDGRRYLLDIPVAVFSGLSVLFYLLWDKKFSYRYLALSMIFLGIAFLTKGPVTLIFYFTAVISWQLTKPGITEQKLRYWLKWTVSFAIVIAIVLPWYLYLYQQYPEELSRTVLQEVSDRNILNFSISPLLNLTILGLPWTLVLFALLFKYFLKKDTQHKDTHSTILFLTLWLCLSILPFFFFKTFSRYLYGCLIPLSILVTVLLYQSPDLRVFKNWFRASAIISSLIGFFLLALVLWFTAFDITLFLSLIMIAVFITVWWRASHPLALALTSVLYWFSVTAIIYPRIGINAIPAGTENLISNEYTVLYAGPQPAMLPISAKRGLRATSRLWTLPEEVLSSCKGFLLFAPENMLSMAKKQMSDLSLDYIKLNEYKILSSRGSWARFTREGTTLADWRRAIQSQDLNSLGTKILLLRVTSKSCQL